MARGLLLLVAVDLSLGVNGVIEDDDVSSGMSSPMAARKSPASGKVGIRLNRARLLGLGSKSGRLEVRYESTHFEVSRMSLAVSRSSLSVFRDAI